MSFLFFLSISYNKEFPSFVDTEVLSLNDSEGPTSAFSYSSLDCSTFILDRWFDLFSNPFMLRKKILSKLSFWLSFSFFSL